MNAPLEIFFSYAHEDEDLMNDVRRQLIVFERNGRILKWHDRMIPPGAEWRNQIDARLEAAGVVLLFMSPHFIESRYCYEIEGEAALQRHKVGAARVIPIVLRPCAWEETPFGAIQALPRDAKPISRWADRDEACLDAARGVMKVVDELAASVMPPVLEVPPASGAAPNQESLSSTNTAVFVKDELPLFQDVFLFARGEMGKTSTGGEVFAQQWVRHSGNVDFGRFKEAFAFAKYEMGKTSTGGEVFAQQWVRDFGSVDFGQFKEAFAFARIEMGKTSTGAESFALEIVRKGSTK